MTRGKSRALSIVCVAVLVAALAAMPAVGSETTAGSFISPRQDFYPADVYEAGAGDDTKVDARYISSIPGPGEDPYTESHTLDDAQGVVADQDWFYFTVTTDDINHKRAFLIEAATNYQDADTFIELYGPGLAWTATDPLDGSADPVAVADNDDGRFMWHGSSLTFLPYRGAGLGAGTYRFRVRPYAESGVYDSCAGPYTMRIKKGSLERIYSTDRIKTALAISQEQWPTNPPLSQNKAVVLANAFNFPDALAGSLLAGVGYGPILLTPPDGLPAAVADEITRIGADKVYVLGGEGVVSAQVISDLQNMANAPAVDRVFGVNRYQTAAAIALQAQSDASGYSETVSDLAIVVSGENFPDALAASAFAAANNTPVLLTRQAYLSSEAEVALGILGTTDVVVVGGPGAVSTAVTDRLETLLGSNNVHRVWGNSRYETAKEFAAWACDLKGPGTLGNGFVGTTAHPSIADSLLPDNVGVASGENFPDALAGGVMAGHDYHPILLNPKYGVTDYIFEEHTGKLPAGDTDYFGEIGGDPIMGSRLFGGPGAVSDSAYLMLDQFFGFTMNP